MAEGKQYPLTFNFKSLIEETHLFFLVVSLVFGSIFIFLVPPIQSPDESNHFHRAFHIADGSLMGEKMDGNRFGGELPSSVLSYSRPFETIVKKQFKPDWYTLDSIKALPLQSAKTEFIDFANVAYYSPTVYLPQSLVIAFFKVFEPKPHFLLLVSRCAGLLFYILIFYFSLKILPSAKELFLFLGLLPSILILHSSVSGDIVSNSLCFMLIAVILWFHHRSEERVSLKLGFGMLVLVILLTLNKFFLFPLALLILLLKKDQLWKDSKWSKLLFIVIPFLLAFFWANYANHQFIPYTQYHPDFRLSQQLNWNVNPGEQFKFVLSQPLSFIKTAAISYYESKFATAAHYVGKFGWEKNYLPSIIIALLWFSLVLNLIHPSNKLSFSKFQKMIIALIFAMLVLGFTVGIYCQWSPLRSNRVLSLSGRYFIPILPFLFLLSPKFSVFERIPLILINRLVIITALIVSCFSIYFRYY